MSEWSPCPLCGTERESMCACLNPKCADYVGLPVPDGWMARPSDTPRTDAELAKRGEVDQYLARDLERELTAAKLRTAELERAFQQLTDDFENAQAVKESQAVTIAELRDRHAKNEAYIKAMDTVIDDNHIARSCINPLEDLKRGVAGLVAERDALAAWKSEQLQVTAWWATVDDYVRKHPGARLGCSVSAEALRLLRERDAYNAAFNSTARALGINTQKR